MSSTLLSFFIDTLLAYAACRTVSFCTVRLAVYVPLRSEGSRVMWRDITLLTDGRAQQTSRMIGLSIASRDGREAQLPLPAGPLCAERCSVGILGSTQSSSCLPSICSMSRQFPEGLLFNRCSGHTPVAGRGGRLLAGFFGALEANAAFCMTAGHMG